MLGFGQLPDLVFGADQCRRDQATVTREQSALERFGITGVNHRHRNTLEAVGYGEKVFETRFFGF